MRGIRGATTVEQNTRSEIHTATRELIEAIIASNCLNPEDIASILFTTTKDLDAAYPAEAVRELGWSLVPLMCFQEMQVENSLEKCIRVVFLWNTDLEQEKIQHIYLRGARELRPDLVK